MEEKRADTALFEAGLAPSRTAAQRLIDEGRAYCGVKRIERASEKVDPTALRVLPGGEEYVSRGAYKLIGALDAFALAPEGLVCADLGASTGGFTQVLLRRGAARVYAIDVGTAQLAPVLREDPRVTVMENTNARALTEESLPERVDLVVYDVSFISATLLYPAVRAILKPGGLVIGLVKPQFEAGREAVGKGGIVRSAQARERSIRRCREAARAEGLVMQLLIPSPIAGGDGNREFLCLLRAGASWKTEIPDEAVRAAVAQSR